MGGVCHLSGSDNNAGQQQEAPAVTPKRGAAPMTPEQQAVMRAKLQQMRQEQIRRDAAAKPEGAAARASSGSPPPLDPAIVAAYRARLASQELQEGGKAASAVHAVQTAAAGRVSFFLPPLPSLFPP